jgi:hypothetical protein
MLNYSLPCSCSLNLSSFCLKPLNQIKPNLARMVPGWVPFKIVSDSPALHSRWLLLLKIEISSIVHCCFSISQNESVIWFSGFRGEDLNMIFNQNMPNLHNRYKSAERKISQKNPEYMLNYSLPCRSLSKLCPTAPLSIQDGCCY